MALKFYLNAMAEDLNATGVQWPTRAKQCDELLSMVGVIGDYLKKHGDPTTTDLNGREPETGLKKKNLNLDDPLTLALAVSGPFR